MTAGQDKAFAFLNDYYGDAHVSIVAEDGRVKITGVDEDGENRARWIVRQDGSIEGAWDPDMILEKYQEQRME